MNPYILNLKEMNRAMKPYVLTLYGIVCDSKPEKVLEIGVRAAQSTRTILSALQENKFGKLVSIDKSDTSSRVPEDLQQYWQFILGNTHDDETVKKASIEHPYDILFIDGDHTYAGVKEDFEKYMHLVRPGGLILMHDICNKNEGVKEFWNEITLQKIAFTWSGSYTKIIAGLGIVQVPL